jgi:hypothetical protein
MDAAWKCAACDRTVPSGVDRCRCGAQRNSLGDTSPTVRTELHTFTLRRKHVQVFLGLLALVLSFYSGMATQRRLSRNELLTSMIDQWKLGRISGFEEGFKYGRKAMSVRAAEIVESSAGTSQAATLVSQRSPDEEAILKIQRERLEREECQRTRGQYGALCR